MADATSGYDVITFIADKLITIGGVVLAAWLTARYTTKTTREGLTIQLAADDRRARIAALDAAHTAALRAHEQAIDLLQLEWFSNENGGRLTDESANAAFQEGYASGEVARARINDLRVTLGADSAAFRSGTELVSAISAARVLAAELDPGKPQFDPSPEEVTKVEGRLQLALSAFETACTAARSAPLEAPPDANGLEGRGAFPQLTEGKTG